MSCDIIKICSIPHDKIVVIPYLFFVASLYCFLHATSHNDVLDARVGKGMPPAPVCLLRPAQRSLSFWSWSKPPKADFELVKPAPQLLDPFPIEQIPKRIPLPPYALTGDVDLSLIPKTAVIWEDSVQLARIKAACQLARKVLEVVKSEVGPGVTTEQLDVRAREEILIHGAYPSCRNFHGFPKCISTSVNNVAAHGIPDSRALVAGDILNIDVTVFLNGFHGDCSDTVCVGEVDNHAKKLIKVTEDCVEQAISICRPGEHIRKIGHVIHKTARASQCTTVPLFLGHGIGDFFHGPPDIYHCLNNYPGRLLPGMVFTIEPVVSEGDRKVKILADGWTAVTLDNSRTAQKEHTVLITDTGVEVMKYSV